MIAPRELPPDFAKWNRRWGAPHGRRVPVPRRFRFSRLANRYRGRFAHQQNSETRAFEYPWAHAAIARHGEALKIVEIGGGLSGMQFVLSSEGHHVINIDPGGSDHSMWGFDGSSHKYLCELYDAPVQLVPDTLRNARLAADSADVVMSVSVLEHLQDADLEETAAEIKRILRPNGIVVMTVDLFKDLYPFTELRSGDWGRNISVRRFLELADLDLVLGDRAELFGFDEFRRDQIATSSSSYLLSRAGSMAQCLVGRRRASPSIAAESRRPSP
jgi:2-polyprenyl-3-methyl-5-hydroxy-6-metoxy-1,4-benzoquinol methylase